MKIKLDFMRWRRHAVSLSALLVAVSLAAVGLSGLNLGLDFTGGTLVEARLMRPVPVSAVRGNLETNGFRGAVVQNLGSEHDIIVRVPSMPGTSEFQLADRLQEVLRATYPGTDIRRAEFVGPVVGEDLRDSGGLAILGALAATSLYIMWRFTDKFALAAAIALAHDVVITVGMFALFQWQFDLATLAALLTVIGYSLNDTIVICDRIRENLRKLRKANLVEVINTSLNQTLERTVIMSGTTLLVLVTMLVLGGEQLRGFAAALTIGVIVGTWSSIYVAAAFLVYAKLSRSELMLETDEQTPTRTVE